MKCFLGLSLIALLAFSFTASAGPEVRELSPQDSHALFSALRLVGVKANRQGGLAVSSIRCFRDVLPGNGIPFSACVLNSRTGDLRLVNGARSERMNENVAVLTLVVNRIGVLSQDTPHHTTSTLGAVSCEGPYACTITQ